MEDTVTMDMKQKQPKIAKIWLSCGGRQSHNSMLMAIPTEFRKEYDLDKPTNVLVIPTEEGLLIKKLEIAK
jgi:hypothetical protein